MQMESLPTCKLNLDIFHAILAHTEQRDASKLMQTCRVLYGVGARYVLIPGVKISTKNIVSFVLFMKAEEDTERRQALRSLTICPDLESGEPSVEAARGLNDLFLAMQAVSSLRWLSIGPAEIWLSLHSGLTSSIASLTSLEELVITSGGKNTIELLENMQSALISVHVEFDEEDGDDDINNNTAGADGDNDDGNNGGDGPDFIRLFKRSQDTLDIVAVYHPGHTSSEGPVYPKVDDLSVGDPFAPVTTDYVRAFPNLTSLTMYSSSNTELERDEYEDHRAENQEQQVARGSWSSLTSFAGSIHILYLLGLTCHVPTVRLDLYGPRPYPPMLQAVLSDTRPTEISLELDGACRILDDGFAAALCAARDYQIDILHIDITVCCEDVSMHIAPILDAALAIVMALKPTLFGLHVSTSCMNTVYCPHEDLGQTCPAALYKEGNSPAFPFELSLAALDVAATERCFRSFVPTLEKIYIETVLRRRCA
ncbi:hypothetical protein C8Q80DRAFT_1269028 [Daedaleopsis nitida]|nr:hypothetical protein C8Q80DRAFT_1269028 [Daedaleopsis nitida]